MQLLYKSHKFQVQGPLTAERIWGWVFFLLFFSKLIYGIISEILMVLVLHISFHLCRDTFFSIMFLGGII